MELTSTDTDLTSALQLWCNTTFEFISKNLINLVQPIGMPTWYKDENENFIKLPYRIIYKYKEVDELIFGDFEEWNALQNIALKHHNFSKHINLVGTSYGSSFNFTMNDLCKILLPLPKTNGKDIFLVPEFDINKNVKNLVDAINATTFTKITIWPISGISANHPIKLDDQTIFRELTDQEKISCLDFEIIKPFQEDYLENLFSKWFGLIRFETILKEFGSRDTVPVDLMQKISAKETVLEDFLSIVPLIGNKIAYHAGGYYSAPHFETTGILSRGVTAHIAGTSVRFMFFDENTLLTEEGSSELKQMWDLVRNNTNNKVKKRVINAMKRLFYAETRLKPEDKLIDCMIAAESLYLDDDKNELSYRLALNASIWSDSNELKKEEIYVLLKKAYTLRSKIVHGSFIRNQDLNIILSQVKIVLQSGIIKAFKGLKSGDFPPKWTKMLLEK